MIFLTLYNHKSWFKRKLHIVIEKAKETMTAKERVLKTFNLEKPIGYEANSDIHMRVAKALGIPDGNAEYVKQAPGVDYRGVYKPYKGSMLLNTSR